MGTVCMGRGVWQGLQYSVFALDPTHCQYGGIQDEIRKLQPHSGCQIVTKYTLIVVNEISILVWAGTGMVVK